MNFTNHDIATITGVTPTGKHSTRQLTRLLTDSRSLIDAERTLFFALRTRSNDGHRFLPTLYASGVRCFVVDTVTEKNRIMMPEAEFFVVDNVQSALHRISKAHRAQFIGKMVSITGSRGKTIVKEWLYQVLAPTIAVSRSPRSFNSQVGVPLSLASIDNESTEIAIIEAGISREGEMALLHDLIRPNIGILTNILPEHDENFPGKDQRERLEALLKEKLKLFSDAEIIVTSIDNGLIDEVRKQCRNARIVTWSKENNPEADIQISISRGDTPDVTNVRFCKPTASPEYQAEVNVRFTSPAALENIGHVIATTLTLYPDTGIGLLLKALPRLTPIVSRTAIIEGHSNTTLLHDQFATDQDSLEQALDYMSRRTTPLTTSTLILGTPSATRLTTLPAETLPAMITNRGIGRIVTVGRMPKWIEALTADPKMQIQQYSTEKELIEAIDNGHITFANELVLVKGNESGTLRNVVERLESQRHETVLEVDLNAIVHNFNFYKQRLRPTTGIVCMVKAFGYGAGSYELAKTLQSQGAAYLAVAVLDEGVELRHAGITMPIMVMNPRVENYDELFAHHLEPEVYSFEELLDIAEQAHRRGITKYPVHLKFDTGMHRLGFIGSDLPRLIELLKAHPEIEARSMFSHLAAADCPDMDDYTMDQFEKFELWSDTLQQAIPDHHILRHILNSTGITRFPERQYDMVRLGICLYGVATMTDGSQNGLRPVSALYTTVISIKHWEAGTTIGYSRRGKCTRDSVIATIPIGYADGIDRHLGNGAMKVWINGSLCPTIGNICMDACMVDVTDCVNGCHVGDRVEIFGPNIPVERLSEALDTIPYEILTSVSTRVKRVYFHE